MAGDHKCPVCQSTFTRPQHVARHMRSHTGDRPYKCQHCGDQFARSDLLSRHVNKCHASEKPPTTTAPNRRKGAAAASRATTSKQACDQCVQSSLPCDGSNPCSKCVQRKCRCTYVKFHRQTAPQGPGHPLPNPLPPQARHSLSLGARSLDDFALAPQSAPYNLASLYAPVPSTSEYALPPPVSTMYHGYHTPADLRDSPAASSLTASSRDSIGDSPDVLARYRAQAELLSRAGVLPNGALAGPPTSVDAGMPSLYAEPQLPYARYSNNLPAVQPPTWDQSHDAHQQQSFHVLDEHRKDFNPQYGTPGRNLFSPTRDAGGSTLPHPHAFPALSSAATGAQNYNSGVPFRPREDLNDDLGSDGGSTGHPHSVPSSTNSSTIHLPVVDQHRRSQYSNYPHPDHSSGSHGSSTKHDYEHPAQTEHGQDGHGEGGFSSAFGLMSLDDPNVLAGLASDAPPFFSNNGLSLQTPTQDIIAALKTGKNDTDSRELRDFWKMYMRTPLSGPGGANILSLATPTGSGQMLGGGRPSPSRRHSRVASLPSMKTPPLHADIGNTFAPRVNSNYGSQRNEHGDQGAGGGNSFSSMRTTLHDAEDLKSYEQAVLARRAPMNLNLVPKRKATLPSQSHAPDVGHGGPSKSASPDLPPHSSMPHTVPDLSNRPSSSGSGTSSLAYAFWSAENASHGQQQPRSAVAHQQQQQPSMRPSSAVGSDAGTDSDGGSSYRPSFKRLASQTLGPEHSKRALLGPAGWEEDGQDELDGDDDEDEDVRSAGGRMDSRNEEGRRPYPGDRPTVSLSGRHRRLSAPTLAQAEAGVPSMT